jgi:cytidine deaminase
MHRKEEWARQENLFPCVRQPQVLLETEKRINQPMRILLYGKEEVYEVKSIRDLLPLSFDGSEME